MTNTNMNDILKNGYIVRAVSEKDIPGIVRLEEQCFSHPMSEDNAKSFLLGDNSIAFVCCETKSPDLICAYCGALCILDEAQVLNVATAPSHRGRGLGRLVTETLLTAAREKSVISITLEVRESNDIAKSLYKSLGFYEIGRIKKYYTTPTEDALILKLDLK